jgi:peptidoglycan/xylan/chitin deacetylase (PgdA/CDA1 family)
VPLVVATWTARARDAVACSPAAIVRRLAPAVCPGAILALHDGRGLGGSEDRAATLAALPELLRLVDARGLRCVRIDELTYDERPGAATIRPPARNGALPAPPDVPRVPRPAPPWPKRSKTN